MTQPSVTPRPKAGVRRGQSLMKAARRSVIARAEGRCEARIEGVCTGWGSHAHHIRSRGRGGSDIALNLLWVCGAGGCHDWIHAHPEMAVELGFLQTGAEA